MKLYKTGWFLSMFPFGAITLAPFGIYFKEQWYMYDKRIVNHESIHWKQQMETLILPFYVWYLIEWFIKLFIYGKKAYFNISFERESYKNENNLDYLKNRKSYSWLKFL